MNNIEKSTGLKYHDKVSYRKLHIAIISRYIFFGDTNLFFIAGEKQYLEEKYMFRSILAPDNKVLFEIYQNPISDLEEKYQSMFSGKNKKTISCLPAVELAHKG